MYVRHISCIHVFELILLASRRRKRKRKKGGVNVSCVKTFLCVLYVDLLGEIHTQSFVLLLLNFDVFSEGLNAPYCSAQTHIRSC